MVLALTTLLIVVALVEVPTAPKMAVSLAPGLPVLGFQLALSLQLFAPGVAWFHTNVAAEAQWIVATRADKTARIRSELSIGFMVWLWLEDLFVADRRLFALVSISRGQLFH